MATSDSELETEVRNFTGIDTALVDATEFETVLSDAKRHIKLERSLTDDQTDWYNKPAQEDALNWATKLFLKVAAGELDSQGIQVGAIDHSTLLAKDNNEVTEWYRRMTSAIRRINVSASYGIVSPERHTYGDDEDDSGGSLTL